MLFRSNITFIVLNNSYDIEIPKLSKSSRHFGAQIYTEGFSNALYQIELKLSWAGKKPGIISHNLDKLYVKNNGKAGKTYNVYFADSKLKGANEKDLMKGKPLKVLFVTFDNKNESDVGSPVFNKKTNEFIGMKIRVDKSADGKSDEYSVVSSVEFIKLMKKIGIIKKKPWYRF